ncbi:MAG: sigma 54-interacting transcriptional regulator [Sphingobacteriaceae bacterium]|nr:sigma 54-interacting transcriptional regulator [Sphingobacteriaceae bacterium]
MNKLVALAVYSEIEQMNFEKIKTLGQLRGQGYKAKTIKEELRDNLIVKLKAGISPFEGIHGYEESVIPELERAILARHNVLLLGLRGQAKTRLARQMIELLDEYIPVIDGAELFDDPLRPITRFGIDRVEEQGDRTPIRWIHRSERYTEKLATPDVTVADLIGDTDPIKAANLRLSYADERVIHFGLIPRAHRGIFVINELPDLQARIQVALFNILQEGDIQIRGFKLRLPLDLQFVFTANPEDYTNRGSIVTPLKDRIESQILTHYPRSIDIGKKITQQEAQLKPAQRERVQVAPLLEDLIEQVAVEARASEFVDQKSGVSARLTIAAFEQLVSAAERRAILNNEEHTTARISDLFAIMPAITGKVELVYEGEQEGPALVARSLIKKAIRSLYPHLFPDPEKLKKKAGEQPYQAILNWFGEGNTLDMLNEASTGEYASQLALVPGLDDLINRYQPAMVEEHGLLLKEFVLHALSEYSLLSKQQLETQTTFKDLLSSMFRFDEEE